MRPLRPDHEVRTAGQRRPPAADAAGHAADQPYHGSAWQPATTDLCRPFARPRALGSDHRLYKLHKASSRSLQDESVGFRRVRLGRGRGDCSAISESFTTVTCHAHLLIRADNHLDLLERVVDAHACDEIQQRLRSSYFLPSTPFSSLASLTASLPESALILTAGFSSVPFFLISLPRLDVATVSPSLTSRTLPLGSAQACQHLPRVS